ncbi:MAG TPA: hypothetical protein EYQ53_06270 [Candidatus Poseidoniales archaeon]|nr:MAG: hypothetical protein CXT69_02755 [Euryarchaeota archaeon]HIG03966.1 hypothetical protein [Candidatus Poseidoniales archaeon]
MASTNDTGVERAGTSLDGQRVLFGISGGIAAVDSVRIARELRRHGADVVVCMTHSALRIINALPLKWATGIEPIVDWGGDMTQLEGFNAVLVAPATRNILASHAHGILSSPLLMALTAARGKGIPSLFIPSMHSSLSDDPVTGELVDLVRGQGANVFWGEEEEGRMKTPSHVDIVAELGHLINSKKPQRKSVVVTLGATRSAIDDVRFVQNASSGQTGWAIATHLHRMGHDVTVVAGATSCEPEIKLPLTIGAESPDEMLAELLALSNDNINAWVHSAAVLDYVVENPIEGKVASLQGGLEVRLVEGKKHILELREKTSGACRIGFKLESGVKIQDLVYRAVAQIKNAGMTAVIANRLEDIQKINKGSQEDIPSDLHRAHLVDSNSEHWALKDERAIVEAIEILIQRH